MIFRKSNAVFLISALLFTFGQTPAASPSAEDSVWVILGVHGSQQLAPQLMQAYADESAEFIEQELKRTKTDRRRPLVIWFERFVPIGLFYSITDPASFYLDLEERSGIPLNLLPFALLDPAAPQGHREKVEKALLEIFEEHEALFEEEGGETFVMPDVFKEWLRYLKQLRPVTAKYEKSSYEAWVETLKSNLWASGMVDSLMKGNVEAALAADVRYNVLLHSSNSIRDRRFADRIAEYYRRSPEALHIVIVGAAHDRIAAFLNREGIRSRNLQLFDYRASFSAVDYFVNYEARPDVFTASFRPAGKEREYASRDIIEQLATLHLVQKGIEVYYHSPVHAPLKELFGRLNPDELGEWRKLMAAPSRNIGEKTALTWNWLISKEPALGSRFSAAPETPPGKARKKKSLVRFDGRAWGVVFEEETKSRYHRQFVPEGETLTNWTELVTESRQEGSKSPEWVSRRAGSIKENLSIVCSDFSWKILEDKPADILYEWSSPGCYGQGGHSEIARVVSGSSGYYTFRYTVKKSPMPAGSRELWQRLLSESEVP